MDNPPNVVIPTPSIRITLSLRVPAALSVEGFLLVRYSISGIAGTRCVKYRRLVAFIVYLRRSRRRRTRRADSQRYEGFELRRSSVPVEGLCRCSRTRLWLAARVSSDSSPRPRPGGPPVHLEPTLGFRSKVPRGVRMDLRSSPLKLPPVKWS